MFSRERLLELSGLAVGDLMCENCGTAPAGRLLHPRFPDAICESCWDRTVGLLPAARERALAGRQRAQAEDDFHAHSHFSIFLRTIEELMFGQATSERVN